MTQDVKFPVDQVTLKARFKLDGTRPVSGIEDGTRFYFIELSVNADQPEHIHKVTYLLDDSYFEPRRERTNARNAFKEEITSYGDFPVRVELEGPGGTQTQEAKLSSMLEVGHADDANPWIKRAIADLREG